MYSVSKHTVQVNCWIALTKARSEFSHTLDRYGYKCDYIEKSISVDGDVAKPDVVLTSRNEQHSIFVDCKGRGVDDEQHLRYKKLEDNTEVSLGYSRFKDDLDKSKYYGELCYSSFTDLSREPAIISHPTAVVHFENTTSGMFLSNPHEFNSSTVNSAFPINMDRNEKIPIEYYPFDIEQSEDYTEFVSALIQAVLRTAMRDGILDVEEVLNEAHPYWENIGKKKREQYISEAKKVMVKLEQENIMGFIENIAETDTEWKVHHKTADAIQDRLGDPEYIEEIAGVVEQSTFDENGELVK